MADNGDLSTRKTFDSATNEEEILTFGYLKHRISRIQREVNT
jgi:hypothetical protein